SMLFSNERDFCSFAVLMAAQNEASIWVSSASRAARNTPRSRYSSAHHQRSSDLSASASASLIASKLRRYDPRGAKLQPLVLDNTARSGSIRSLASPLFRHQSRT